MAIEWHSIDGSSNIHAMGYDPVEQILEVKFKGGTHYRYAGVPSAEWQTLHAAKLAGESVGKLFHRSIRPHHTGVPVTPEK